MNKQRSLGILMDPISRITPYKDTSFALLLEAQRRGLDCYYFEPQALYLDAQRVFAHAHKIAVQDNDTHWYDLEPAHPCDLSTLDLILVRLDPPVDTTYQHAVRLLDFAAQEGACVLNPPNKLLHLNEKLFAQQFPELCPPTLVSSQKDACHRFIEAHQQVIAKPLDGMGGRGIFKITAGDTNTDVILETLTHQEQLPIMLQRFIPDIKHGDKRVILIHGEPIPYMLSRHPSATDNRGNLAAGGRGTAEPLNDAAKRIAAALKAPLQAAGLYFVGIDIIGDYLTEINITSPTCVREIERAYNVNICGQFFDGLDAYAYR